MAVSELVMLSEDMIIRQAYEKRQDEIMLHDIRVSNYKREIKEKDAIIADKGAEIEPLRLQLEELRSRLGENT